MRTLFRLRKCETDLSHRWALMHPVGNVVSRIVCIIINSPVLGLKQTESVIYLTVRVKRAEIRFLRNLPAGFDASPQTTERKQRPMFNMIFFSAKLVCFRMDTKLF